MNSNSNKRTKSSNSSNQNDDDDVKSSFYRPSGFNFTDFLSRFF